MPTYEDRCETCGETFERRESVVKHEAVKSTCPKCASEKVARAFSAFYAKTSKELNGRRRLDQVDLGSGITSQAIPCHVRNLHFYGQPA